tara:strand:- start:472 stop:795 length:324 start_codon:yes stop_codon:yes gene_type:complete
MGLFRKKKSAQIPLRRSGTFTPARKGKTRIDSRKIKHFNRKYNKQSAKLKKSGFKISGGKPINQMTHTEFQKLQKKVMSGKYDVQYIAQPPKWKNEPPREWAMLRRK